MQRVVVIGTTGAGKTVLAARLAAALGAPHVELDALHWGPNWTPRTDFPERVASAISGDCWVVDGNYSRVQASILSRADTLVWLDYSFGTKLWRLAKRSTRRAFTREALWNGNVETLRGQFLSRDSLFVWHLRTHWAKRRRYEALMRDAQYGHLRIVRLLEPRGAEKLLEEVSNAARPGRPFQD